MDWLLEKPLSDKDTNTLNLNVKQFVSGIGITLRPVDCTSVRATGFP
jgi:hypothetical protein